MGLDCFSGRVEQFTGRANDAASAEPISSLSSLISNCRTALLLVVIRLTDKLVELAIPEHSLVVSEHFEKAELCLALSDVITEQ